MKKGFTLCTKSEIDNRGPIRIISVQVIKEDNSGSRRKYHKKFYLPFNIYIISTMIGPSWSRLGSDPWKTQIRNQPTRETGFRSGSGLNVQI